MKKIKSYLLNFLLIFISVGLTFFLCEYIYRKALFGTDEAFQKYRFPNLYADKWDENYWKLAQIWKITKPAKSHQLLGWNHRGWRKTLFHGEVPNIGKKRPVLLYGDSFAQCIDPATCFESYLNSDTEFVSNYYFINYGTGAYGVDQIYTMFRYTFMHYKDPIVIFSFLTDDLVRSGLTFRECQKPVYTIQKNGSLQLDTTRYIPSNIAYLKKYPPSITSYLYRKFLYSNANFLPRKITKWLTGETSNRKKIMKLNEKLITDAVKLLRQSKTDFFFLIFQEKQDYLINEKDNWRVNFIRNTLDKNQIKYIWAEDLIKDKVNLKDTAALSKYHIKNDGHPTGEFNRLVAEAIKQRILNGDYENFDNRLTKDEYLIPGQKSFYYTDLLDSVINKIKSDSTLLKTAIQSSIEKNIPLDKAVTDLALWTLWHEEE
jgi:hypothetical protein